MRRLALAALAVAWALTGPVTLPGAADAKAQGLGLAGDGDQPIEVYAHEGIEWDQTEKRYVARGKARAKQGDTTVHGDSLIAYYDDKGKGSEIYRIDAIGHVRIVTPTETAYGDKAVYDVAGGVLVLTGSDLRLVTQGETVTARDSLEYYDAKGMAVARGDAHLKLSGEGGAEGEPTSVQADVLTAYFRSGEDREGKKPGSGKGGDKGNVKRMEAFGNVVVTRPGEIARGDRGLYLPDQDTAELWGSVRITRGENQLNGERAIVNFVTGKSRLLAGEAGAGGPVRALIVPNRSSEGAQ